MLIARGLQKSFRSRQVVHDFAFEIKQGEVVGLLGPNGAGKTTCFYMIVGLIEPDGGRITLDGQDITGLPMHARARLGIGYLPQEPSVFRRLSVADNVLAVLELRRDLDAAQRQRELESLLDELKVSHIADQKGVSLSGGERRRVEIARALAAKPRLLLLDEPTAGMNEAETLEAVKYVRRLRDELGVTILLIEHKLAVTMGMSDRIAVLDYGRKIAEGLPEAIRRDERVIAAYLGRPTGTDQEQAAAE